MDKKPNLHLKGKSKVAAATASDSEGSNESSPSADSAAEIVPKTPTKDSQPVMGKRAARRESEWEILEGLREGQRFERKPDKFSGHLHKKRKWPLKGWHKRYFVLDKGVLVYGKNPSDVARGKLHGSLDIGLSVISAKQKRKRLDIDAEEFIYHLKAKADEEFVQWVDLLTQHRLYRQHQLCFGTRDIGSARRQGSSEVVADVLTVVHRDNFAGEADPLPASPALGSWVPDSFSVVEALSKELTQTAHNLNQLAKIHEQLEQSLLSHDSEPTADGFSPNVKKDRRKFGLRKKKSNKGSTADLTGSSPSKAYEAPDPNSLSGGLTRALSNSQSSLPGMLAGGRPPSFVDDGGLLLDFKLGATPDCQLREDFAVLAKDIHSTLKMCCHRLLNERDRLHAALAQDPGATNMAVTLRQALQQNVELKHRLTKIHSTSDLSDVNSIASENNKASMSYSSPCLSGSEFFDAEEDRQDTSSEVNSLSSEENSTENSEAGNDYTAVEPIPPVLDHSTHAPYVLSVVGPGSSGRRSKLPVPRPDTEGLSLWNLLCKNIGQDLSQISMPVALNEPLNMLQRMCEELEYSELLDKAAGLDDPYERMVYVAAFAVSSYGSSFFRAGSKPFNPLLGETYECVRDDRGFRFVAEQVSHHPPVSVCHAESSNYIFWQDARIKTKFWGKSMEFQPTGVVNLLLPKHNDRYRWNKVTTCVHNLFSGQRWVDQYGELKITNGKIVCKLAFVKASYWSAKRHEVFGTVTNENGKVVRNIFGKWSEALYCGTAPNARCIWRPGPMPDEYELYYGFTRFAMELNEIDTDMAKYLPVTDTRFRPDQRLLEEGNLEAAESLKMQLEQTQRERRKMKEEEQVQHLARWFRKCSNDTWESNHTYWETRKSPGFASVRLEALW